MSDDRSKTTRERVCETCGAWVYFDNGDCTFHCLCMAGWVWKETAMTEPKTTPDEERLRQLDRAILDTRRYLDKLIKEWYTLMMLKYAPVNPHGAVKVTPYAGR